MILLIMDLYQGATVDHYEVVKMTHHGSILNLEQTVDEYNSKFSFLEEPIQILEVL